MCHRILISHAIFFALMGAWCLSASGQSAESTRGDFQFDTIGEAYGVNLQDGEERFQGDPPKSPSDALEMPKQAFDALVVGPLYGEKRRPPAPHALSPLRQALLAHSIKKATLYSANYQQSLLLGVRYEGVHVIEFHKKLDDSATELTDLLLQMSGEPTTLANRNVLAVPWEFERADTFSKAKWEELLFVTPKADSNTVVYATSRRALEAYLTDESDRLISRCKNRHGIFSSKGMQAWVAQLKTEEDSKGDGELQVRRAMAWSAYKNYQILDVLIASAEEDKNRLAGEHEGLADLIDPLADAGLTRSGSFAHLQLILLLAPFQIENFVFDEEANRTLSHGKNISTYLHAFIRL